MLSLQVGWYSSFYSEPVLLFSVYISSLLCVLPIRALIPSWDGLWFFPCTRRRRMQLWKDGVSETHLKIVTLFLVYYQRMSLLESSSLKPGYIHWRHQTKIYPSPTLQESDFCSALTYQQWSGSKSLIFLRKEGLYASFYLLSLSISSVPWHTWTWSAFMLNSVWKVASHLPPSTKGQRRQSICQN